MSDKKTGPRCAGVGCVKKAKCLRFWDRRTGWVDQMNPANCTKYLEVVSRKQLDSIIQPQRTL